MSITSYGFLLFAGVLLLLYYIVPRRFQWCLLLIASYVFYAFSGVRYLGYILATTLCTYGASRIMGRLKDRQETFLKENKAILDREDRKFYKASVKKRQKRWLTAALLFNFGILAVIKYGNFVIGNVGALFGVPGDDLFFRLVLPLGISFYTFQTTGYLIDLYRGDYEPEKNFFRFSLFVSFFPQLIQGPISRFGALKDELYGKHAFDRRQVAFGLQRMLYGFFKKMVIADRIMTGLSTISGDPTVYTGAYAFAGMIFYAIDLYMDFSGGIDIVIGFSQALGIRLPENFRQPYFAVSLKDYWHRWHITLCDWFKDYVFYPISTSPRLLGLSKKLKAAGHGGLARRITVYTGNLTVWTLTGVWHGAAWNFIIWGLLNGCFLLLSQEMEPLYRRFYARFPALKENKPWKAFRILRTFLFVSLLCMFDYYSGAAAAGQAMASMVTQFNPAVLVDGSLLEIGLTAWDYGILLLSLILVFIVSLLKERGLSVRERIAARPLPVRVLVWYGLFLIVLLFGAYGIGYDASQFIYNQF
ncbi:MAG: MBOAT family protein [Lachnospiraceae bacterium]|jgi:alginate O-acetyltransferase complex protein AlgI|nr:MBOAT family protein [Lachnospiraceae bacterium]